MDRTPHPTFSLKMLRGEAVEEVPISQTTGEIFELVSEITAITQCVRTGSAPPCSGSDGRWAVAMCLKAQESVETGKIVPLVSE